MSNRNTSRRAVLILGASTAAMVASGAVYAQASDADVQLEEITVTAQKRSQSLQDVPLSISAFDAAFTKRVNIDDVKDLVKFAPGFSGDSKDSFIDYINIRGISTNDFGIGGDPSVGFFKNGMYQGRNGVVVSSMFDMERAEVLRGPQGFLFGRNAIGGAISLYTAKPNFETVSGHADVGFGERGIFEAEAAVNLPINNNFALRFAGYHSEEDGYAYNYYDGKDYVWHNKDAVRATAAMKGDIWDATFMFEYEDRKQSGSVYRALEGDTLDYLESLSDIIGDPVPSGDEGDIDSDNSHGNYDIGDITTLSAEFNFDLGFATLTSLTGYKDHTYEYAEDFDGTPIGFNDYTQDQSGDYFEQELRLVSNGEGPLSWYAGVSYYHENIKAEFNNANAPEVLCGVYYEMTCADLFDYWETPYTPQASHDEINIDEGTYEGWGAYVDVAYAISDKLDIDVGLRYTKDKKNFGIKILPIDDDFGPFFYFTNSTSGFIRESKSWDDFSPRAVLRYRPNDDWMMYASVTKGYKSGGFNSFGLLVPEEDQYNIVVSQGDASLQSFDPEVVWSYEVGVKGDMLDKKLRLDLSSYYYRYTDLQINYYDQGAKVDNVGKVKAFGIEATAQAVLGEYFNLLLAGSYNHNKVSDAEDIEPGSSGNRLTGVPKFSLAGVFSYHQPVSASGAITSSVEFRTQSKTYGGLANTEEYANAAWTDVTIRVGYENEADGWSVSGYVENIFDEVYYDGTSEGSETFPAHGFGVSRPRTFGIRFSKEFGQ